MMNFPSEADKKQWRYEDFVQATSAEYMLRQLAEECCELSQAALKLIRAHNRETPVKIPQAIDALVEEIADTLLMIDVVRYGVIPSKPLDIAKMYSNKWHRFKDRVLKP